MPGPTEPEPSGRVLSLRLALRSYIIDASMISGVARAGALRPVPLAPSSVLGVTDWRGRLLTVLDLPALVGDHALGHSSCLVRLAPPHDGTALLVPGSVRLVPAPDGHGEPDAAVALDVAALLLEVRGQIDALAAAPRGRN